MTLWQTILLGYGAVILLMAALWLLQRSTRNAGTVDVAWSFATALLGIWFALAANGLPERRYLVALLVGLWGLRLGSYLLKRVLSEREDGRYQALRAQWGPRTQPYLFLFFQVQAFWALLFALPILGAASNPSKSLHWPDFLGLAIWLTAVAGESIADAQLSRFRRDPANTGRVCEVGLWYYSRHPNYFFEWIHWFAYVSIACSGFWVPGLWTLLGPALMYFFITRVTGIPPTERRALESRPLAYRLYQQTTSPLIPWPKRQAPPNA